MFNFLKYVKKFRMLRVFRLFRQNDMRRISSAHFSVITAPFSGNTRVKSQESRVERKQAEIFFLRISA